MSTEILYLIIVPSKQSIFFKKYLRILVRRRKKGTNNTADPIFDCKRDGKSVW